MPANPREMHTATPIESVRQLIIAGWTGRDPAAVRKHIEELRAIGVPPPSTVPVFYEVSSALMTTSTSITVVGEKTSGEVEFVLINTRQGLLVTVGSDHTDRWLETVSVHHSKQICPKPVAAQSWSLESVEAHWDRLLLRAYSRRDDRRVLYQEGPVTNMLAPRELIARYAQLNGDLMVGSAMSCGTLPLKESIEYADRFEIQLEDPVTQRTLSHSYRVKALPVAA